MRYCTVSIVTKLIISISFFDDVQVNRTRQYPSIYGVDILLVDI